LKTERGCSHRTRRRARHGRCDGRFLTDAADEARSVYKVGLNTTRLLLALGDLVIGWLLLRQAEIALTKLPADARDAAFYAGKVAAARSSPPRGCRCSRLNVLLQKQPTST